MDILQPHSLRNPINHHMQISEEEKLVKWASYNSQICITENLPAGVNFSLTGNLLVHKALHTHTILSSKYTCKQKEEMEQIDPKLPFPNTSRKIFLRKQPHAFFLYIHFTCTAKNPEI